MSVFFFSTDLCTLISRFFLLFFSPSVARPEKTFKCLKTSFQTSVFDARIYLFVCYVFFSQFLTSIVVRLFFLSFIFHAPLRSFFFVCPFSQTRGGHVEVA